MGNMPLILLFNDYGMSLLHAQKRESFCQHIWESCPGNVPGNPELHMLGRRNPGYFPLSLQTTCLETSFVPHLMCGTFLLPMQSNKASPPKTFTGPCPRARHPCPRGVIPPFFSRRSPPRARSRALSRWSAASSPSMKPTAECPFLPRPRPAWAKLAKKYLHSAGRVAGIKEKSNPPGSAWK